jgi:hypothetical protein
MVQAVLAGVWATLVALGTFYGVAVWAAAKQGGEVKVEALVPLKEMKTDIISVPMIHKGEVQGYVLARFAWLVDEKKLKELAIDPATIITDEAFRIIYASPVTDFRHIEKYDLASLTKRLKEAVNRRLGDALVHDVLVESINYVARSEIRYKGLKQ